MGCGSLAGIGLGFIGPLVAGLASGGISGAWLSLLTAAAVTTGTLLARSLAGTDLPAGIVLVLGALWLVLRRPPDGLSKGGTKASDAAHAGPTIVNCKASLGAAADRGKEHR